MHRGFTKAWRKELDSDIWLMPSIYHRVWYWLRLKVQWETRLLPTPKGFGIWVLPGQKLTSLEDISEGVKCVKNRREIKPDRKTVKRVLEWLSFNQCIELTCHTTGTLIYIINWQTYNVLQDELATLQGRPPGRPPGHKEEVIKNLKELEEEKNKDKVKRFIPPTIQEITDYCIERKNNVDPDKFFNHYSSNGWMVGKNKMKEWKAAVRTWEGNLFGNTPQGEKPTSFRERVNKAAVDDFINGRY